ncbi:ChaB2 [Buzura suppressaria nucleopolyhedrovirus]|uniref:ChaB2 n=1 Tax=Buzura suppressaria nuclear polyhedrosis virus TaxID=74320 RepID=W5VS42_NPVBS|nr:ChaB2 [Buzura suppressaria nucleopolyhedrovirus]AHH82627.1 ChaB2 [Buzura suppressaria nucleopolyhedrovirus]AKN91009.1 ChaB2 [Buzura suppressaria nucleopolyhedrovirus]QYF10547.1 chaB2 [Buzura suppressaria nucleopolyhedrovirus]
MNKLLTLQNLPQSVTHLPYHGKRIFIKFYNKSIDLDISPMGAYRIAWSAVRKKYYKHNSVWVPYANANDYDTTSSEDDIGAISDDDNIQYI